MGKLAITAVYKKEKPINTQIADYDKLHKTKPHWIRLEKMVYKPRFLSVRTPQNSEVIYKAFGNFYYPINSLPSQSVNRSLMSVAAENFDKIVDRLNISIAEFIFNEVMQLNLGKDIRVLDIGAGTGLTAIPFAKNRYRNLTLIDVSSKMRDVALRKKILKDVNYLVQDSRKLVLRGKYDLVISSMFFCDLSEKGRNLTIKNLIKYLAPKGLIALVEDEDRAIYGRYFKTLEKGKYSFGNYKKFFFLGQKIVNISRS